MDKYKINFIYNDKNHINDILIKVLKKYEQKVIKKNFDLKKSYLPLQNQEDIT